MLDTLGIIHRPLQRLHPADRRANHRAQPLHTQLAQHVSLATDNIANGDEGETRAVRLSSGPIHGRGTSRSVTRPQNVGTYNAIARQIEDGTAGVPMTRLL